MKWVTFILFVIMIIDGFALSFLHPWLLVPLVFLLAGGIYWLRTRTRQHQTVTLAGWSLGSGEEISQPEQPVIVKNVVLPLSALQLGLLGIGSPGSGKTESLFIGLLYYYNDLKLGWAAFDGKGQLDVYQKSVAAGVNPDFFFSSELPQSHTTNLMFGNPDDVTDRLCKVLIGEATSTTFYADEQRAVLLVVVPFLLSLGLKVNLRDLYVFLSNEDASHEILLLAKQHKVASSLYEPVKNWLAMDFNTRMTNVKGMLNRLFVFVSGPFADRINDYHADIVQDDIVAKGQRVYFHLPESRFSKDVAIMLIEQFASIAKRRQQQNLEALALFPLKFDDWGSMFHYGFKPFSARCRSAKMPLSFFFQSRAQLQDVSPTYETELDDNIATKVLLRINGQDTAELASTLMGSFDTREVSTSLLGERNGTSLSAREIPRLKGEDFKSLAPGETYISTLLNNNGNTVNARYHTRFPLLDFPDWNNVPLPTSSHVFQHMASDGLNLWGRYMAKESVTPDSLTINNAEALS